MNFQSGICAATSRTAMPFLKVTIPVKGNEVVKIENFICLIKRTAEAMKKRRAVFPYKAA
jgi:hypothetical protein